MSHWIYLVDAVTGNTLELPERHEEGGTYVLGGTAEASLNVTYNYGDLMRDHRVHVVADLDGKRAGDTIPNLRAAVDLLGQEPDEDYWQPKPGNVGRCCYTLLRWAEVYPDAVWRCSS